MFGLKVFLFASFKDSCCLGHIGYVFIFVESIAKEDSSVAKDMSVGIKKIWKKNNNSELHKRI